MTTEAFTRTAVEQLLVWMSEIGTGSWRRFKDAHAWVFRDRAPGAAPEPGYVAAHLAERGHAEIDWHQQRWAVAPCVLTTVPGLPSAGLVVGGRTRSTLQSWAALDWPEVYLDLNREPPHPPPHPGALAGEDGVRSLFVIADDVEHLQAAAAEMHAAFVWDAGLALASRLPSLTDRVLASKRMPPPPESDVARFVPETGEWQTRRTATEPGLYRFRPRRIGGTEFRLVTAQGSLRIDRSIGIYADLAKTHVDALWYEPSDVHGMLYVRASAPLPVLHARSLHLCSGLRPDDTTLEPIGAVRRYHNVPLQVAEAIATKLSQRLGRVVDEAWLRSDSAP
jgi:hypothetical protein